MNADYLDRDGIGYALADHVRYRNSQSEREAQSRDREAASASSRQDRDRTQTRRLSDEQVPVQRYERPQ